MLCYTQDKLEHKIKNITNKNKNNKNKTKKENMGNPNKLKQPELEKDVIKFKPEKSFMLYGDGSEEAERQYHFKGKISEKTKEMIKNWEEKPPVNRRGIKSMIAALEMEEEAA